MSPFDFVNDIQQGKKNLIAEDPACEKDYVPFLTNKALSYQYDCVAFAHEMSQRYHLDRKLQYDYLLHTVRSRRRTFQKWVKPIPHDTLQAIQDAFGYSKIRAQEVMHILTPDQLMEVMNYTQVGGLAKNPKR